MNQATQSDESQGTGNAAAWEMMDEEVPAAIARVREGLEQALAAVKALEPWVEHVHTLAGIVQQMDSSLAKVRPVLGEHRPSSAPISISERRPDPSGREREREEDVKTEPTPEPSATAETEPGPGGRVASAAEPALAPKTDVAGVGESEPDVGGPTPGQTVPTAPETGQGNEIASAVEAALLGEASADNRDGAEPVEGALQEAEGGPTLRLAIESADANIDLTGLAHAVWETCRASDLDLLDYSGKRALVQIDLSEEDDTGDEAGKQRVAGKLQDHLAELPWGSGISVQVVD